MPILTVKTKKRLAMLCLSGFELYSRWVPLNTIKLHPLQYVTFLNIGGHMY